MGFISDTLLKNYSQADFDRDIQQFRTGVTTRSGVKVSEASALKHITVLSCIRVRSESFGSLPVSVYRKRPGGNGRDEDLDHPLYDLMHNTPNSDMTSMTFRETMNGHLDMSGNCYALISLNRRGQVINLQPWDWDKIEPIRNVESGKVDYRLNDRGKFEIIPANQVFHIPGLGHDGIRGYSIIALAREYIGLGMAVSEFVEHFYGQGMNVGAVLETNEVLKMPAIKEMRELYEENYSGLQKSHRPMILHSGLKYNRIPMTLIDAQTIESLKLNNNQICGLYRVPPHMVGILDQATFSNIEHQGISYVVHSMLPTITRWEQTANWKLLTPQERRAGYYVKVNVDALLRGDSKARGEYLKTKRQNGVINANEWRELDDENPIDGLDGEAYLVNGSMIGTSTAATNKQGMPPAAGGGEEEQNEDEPSKDL